jgi:hypothetical protein
MLPVFAACGRGPRDPFRGYAFIANQEGQAIAALDLEVMAVARHIAVEGAPSQVLAPSRNEVVYALTPETGAVHEIQVYRLSQILFRFSPIFICDSLDPDGILI